MRTKAACWEGANVHLQPAHSLLQGVRLVGPQRVLWPVRGAQDVNSTELDRSCQKRQAAGSIPAASISELYRKSGGEDVGGGLRREPMTGA